MRAFRVAVHQAVREPELHRERDQLLLRAVVDVPLQAAALLVLCGDDPLARSLELLQVRAELLRQSHVPEDEAGLRGEVVEQPALGRRERITLRLPHRQRAQEISTVAHGNGS